LTIVTEGTRPSSREICHAVIIQLNTLSSLTKEQRRSKENSSDSRITRHGSSMEDARLAPSYGVIPVRFKLRNWQGKSWEIKISSSLHIECRGDEIGSRSIPQVFLYERKMRRIFVYTFVYRV